MDSSRDNEDNNVPSPRLTSGRYASRERRSTEASAMRAAARCWSSHEVIWARRFRSSQLGDPLREASGELLLLVALLLLLLLLLLLR